MRSILKSFIVNCVLSDSVVLAKYTKGRCKVPSGKFEIQYRQEMRVLVLYRLMILLIFLDRAKEAHILDKVPRLFTKGSAVKSSRAALQVFCRDFLSAEGDFIKHLNRIGIRVSYEQKPVDELEYDVTNLAVDLRDGVRLTRMTEILTGAPTKTLMTSLRLPAVSRLQKLHNVGVTISTLKDFGVAITNDVNSHHIVDGHREMVLKLMWAVISHSCMKTLLQGNQVKEEIRNVRRSNRARRRMEGLFALSPKGAINEHFPTYESTEEVLKSLLFGWCQAVCSCFGMHLADFTTSFADGKALCYLIHYYHPSAIRLEEILPTSSDEAADLSPQQALANERTNSAMAGSRVSELGGIPKMLPITDTENPPDEKSMLLCLSYLCSRLMESSKEIFASILIQACYRKYHRAVLLEKKKVAALFIFQTWCLRKEAYYRARERRYTAAVEVLEHFFTTHKHSLTRLRHKRLTKEHRHFSAIEIQVSIKCLFS
jgi:abnormal spindle-like microcephaly-associated protein